jgi:hypothetical protein
MLDVLDTLDLAAAMSSAAYRPTATTPDGRRSFTRSFDESAGRSPLWIGFDPDVFLAATARLSCAEIGALVALARHDFLHGGVPPDDFILAAILGISLRQWRRYAPLVLGFFRRDSDRLHFAGDFIGWAYDAAEPVP